jgi:hypothetical protein
MVLMQLLCKSSVLTMGNTVDHARSSIPNDRQFNQFSNFIKRREKGHREVLLMHLKSLGFVDANVDLEEVRKLK